MVLFYRFLLWNRLCTFSCILGKTAHESWLNNNIPYQDSTSPSHIFGEVCLPIFLQNCRECRTGVYNIIRHGRTGRKKVGGRKEKCPTFRDSARLVPKKFFSEKLFWRPPPPPRRQKNFGQCTILGVKKNFRTTNIFRNITRIFEKSQNLPKN